LSYKNCVIKINTDNTNIRIGLTTICKAKDRYFSGLSQLPSLTLSSVWCKAIETPTRQL